MKLGGKPNGVPVPVPPREGLDRRRGIVDIEPRTQDGPVTDPWVERAFKRLHLLARPGLAKRGVPAGKHAPTGIEYVVAQHDVLIWDVLLVGATAIVASHHAAIGGRVLRLVDEFPVEGELLRWMVAGWQAGDERSNVTRHGVDGHDAGAIVLPCGVSGLVGVGREEPPTQNPTLECDVHCRACGLETVVRRGL